MIEICDCSVVLGKKTILDHVSCHVEKHSLTVILGKNGAGKSTLAGCMNQQIAYTGQICLENNDLKKMTPREKAKQISFLPQVLPVFHLTVKDLVRMGRNPYLDLTQRLTKKDKEKIEEAIQTIGIQNLSDRYLDELSGGERQKAYLAMILAQDTSLIVLDEPTAHMDMTYEADFLDCLVHLKEAKGKTILVIMHDLNQAIQIADRLIILEEGKVYYEGSKQDVLDRNILEKVFHVKKYKAENRIFFASK